MNDVTVSQESQQAISLFISIGIPVLVFFVFAVLSIIGATEVIARLRAVPQKVRKYLDEPTDPAILVIRALIRQFAKQEIPADALVEGLKELFDQIETADSVNVGETVK